MTDVAVRDRAWGAGELEVVDAFTEQALAIAASAAAPNTRRAYATAYRAFAAFLHERYGQASLQTFTVTAVAAWRDELTAQGLAASTVAQRVSAVRRLAAAVGASARARPSPAGSVLPMIVLIGGSSRPGRTDSYLDNRHYHGYATRPEAVIFSARWPRSVSAIWPPRCRSTPIRSASQNPAASPGVRR